MIIHCCRHGTRIAFVSGVDTMSCSHIQNI
jgi:hypothetical protein